MKRLVFVIVTNLIFTFAPFAQSSCPSLSVTGPSGLPKSDEPWFFTANLSKEAENYKVEYIWEAIGGKIIEGQGTSNLKVLADEMCSVEVTVKVKGLPENCLNITGSASASISDCNLSRPSVKMDAVSDDYPRIHKEIFQNIALALNSEPSTKAYIVERFKQGTSQEAVKKKLSTTISFLTKNLRISADRVTLQVYFEKDNLTEFWIVPTGATPPEIKESGIEIKSGDFQNHIDKLFPTPKKKSFPKSKKG